MAVDYRYRGREFRMVTARASGEAPWPPPPASAAAPLLSNFPLTALVRTSAAGEGTIDVTARLRGLMGPRCDFHGRGEWLSLEWLLPELETETARLCVLTAAGRYAEAMGCDAADSLLLAPKKP